MLQMPETPQTPRRKPQASGRQFQYAFDKRLLVFEQFESHHAIVVVDEHDVIGGEHVRNPTPSDGSFTYTLRPDQFGCGSIGMNLIPDCRNSLVSMNPVEASAIPEERFE